MRIALFLLAVSGLFAQQNIDSYFERLFDTFLAHDPQGKSATGLFEPNDQLNDVSPKALLRIHREKIAMLEKLQQYELDSLTPEQQISHRVFSWMRDYMVADEKYLFHAYRVNQMFGILNELTFVFTQFHRLETQKDVDLYISRLAKIPKQLEQTIELMKHQRKLGVVPPAFTIEKVIQIIQKSTPASIEENALYSHLASRDVDPAQLAKAARVMQTQVYPAYQKLSDYLAALLKEGVKNQGVWALPDGDNYYAHVLRYHTTTDLTPDEIHAIGFEQIAQIQQEMRSVLADLGLSDPDKTVGELVAQLAKDPQFYFSNDEEGRQECLKKYEAILARCREQLYPLFDLRPDVSVAITPVPAHEQEGTAGAYYLPPSLDRSRPGTFYANMGNMKEVPMYTMETLTIHEAEPGHHFQIALQNEMNIPTLRKLESGFTAYVEGWALYAEKLAYEQGFYSSPSARLGHLQAELLRAVRLVVDTGIHSKRWTREQAIETMQKTTGLHLGTVTREVERYFVYPGQACSYKIGQLKILELRKRAQLALGDRFDIRQFHNVVLKTAAAPLTVLEENIDKYIIDEKSPFF
ncbi:MAG TPA: DUF885 domain-containing protein [Chlamydiales bacterium]|nr:DUF885 domain-containing protein [Chlamydiales bacterium]